MGVSGRAGASVARHSVGIGDLTIAARRQHERSAPGAGFRARRGQQLTTRGNKLSIAGCLICGTWVLGPIGAVILLYGLLLMRRAERAEHPFARGRSRWSVVSSSSIPR